MRRPAAAFAVSRASAIVAAIVVLLVTAAIVASGLLSPTTVPAAAALPSQSTGATAPAISPPTSPRAGTESGSTNSSSAPSQAPPAPTPLSADARDAALQRSLDAFRKTQAIPGISVTIEFDDGSFWTGVSGEANVRTHAPVTAHTTFAVGSISKTFLAALIVQLASEGRLGLDDRVERYLPELKLDARITVRQLLDHTSGLNDFFFNPRIDALLQSDRSRLWTPTRSLSFVGKRYFVPGRGWHYSNTNYVVLGLLAEKVGGTSLSEQMRARFFDKLGMSTTFYQVEEKSRGELAHGNRLVGTGKALRPVDLSDGTGIAPFRSVVSAAGGAGSIAATSRDLAVWAKSLYGGRVLSGDGLALTVADVQRTAAFKPRTAYGLGVQAVTVDGLPTLGHSGRLLGFRGVMRYFAGQGVSIAVLTNQSRLDPAPLLARLARIAIPAAAIPCPTCAGH